MGMAVFVGLVLIALFTIGLAIYGLVVGLTALIRLVARARLHYAAVDTVGLGMVSPASGVAVLRRGAIGAGGARGAPRYPRRTRHCWELMNCPAAARGACSAALRPEAPCWLARMQASGELRPECLTCKLFDLPMLVMQA